MHKTFPTTGPASVYVEIGSGAVEVNATETTEVDVVVEGDRAGDVTVEQRGGQVVVIAPQRHVGFFGLGGDLKVRIDMPLDSELATKLGSADLVTTGRLGSARVKSGSGDLDLEALGADAVVQSGSGDVHVGDSLGDLRVKTGSGHVRVGRLAGSTVIASGSGRITLDRVEEEAVAKTGSGDVTVGDVLSDLSVTSGSGDLRIETVQRGALRAKTASGDVHVGVAAGIPVWTDINTITGDVRSNLEGAGQPEDGEDYIEIRATTASGDVTLSQL